MKENSIMKKIALNHLTIILSFCLISLHGLAQQTKPSHEAMTSKANELADAYAELNWFSGVILMAEEGKPFYQKAFGMADREKQIPNTINTKFRIGSINKTYTDVLVLQLVERGQLSLDDKLGKYLDNFPKSTANKVSIKQLLTHTAGFGDIFIPEYLDNIRSYKSIQDILPLLRDQPLAYEPGTDQRYSNYGYIVLGAILEKITGKSFEQLLNDNIFQALGHINTHYQIAEQIKGEAQSYRFGLNGKSVNCTSNLEYPTPDGGMYSTAAELFEFMQSLYYDERLISDASKLSKVFDYDPPKEFTWEKVLNSPRAAIGDAGGGPGVSTVVEMLLKDNVTIMVLANSDRGIAEEIGFRLMQYYRGESVDPVQVPMTHFLYQTITGSTIDLTPKNLDQLLKKNNYESLSPQSLNQLGYDLLYEKNYAEAIKIFELNTTLYPEEANVYDSLAEAYYKKGDLKQAKKYYQKALDIDPELASAKEMLKKIN